MPETTTTTTWKPRIITITKLSSCYSATACNERLIVDHVRFFASVEQIKAYAKEHGYRVKKVAPGRFWDLKPVAYELVSA